MAKGDYLTKPQFGTPKDDIERTACAWLEANVGTTGEAVMQSLATVMRGLSPGTKIPGLKSAHAIITPTCRANRTTIGAFDEAAKRLKDTYEKYADVDANSDVDWHLLLVRDSHRHGP